MTDQTATGSCPFPHAAATAAPAESGCPAGPARRSFVKAALGAGAGAAAIAGGAFTLSAGPASAETSGAAKRGAVAFHGEHQAGVTTPAPGYAAFVSFDVIAADRAALETLFHTLTDRIRFLTAGGTPPDLGVGAPPADNGILGPVVPTDDLTVTVGVGASLFDGRYGLAKAKPVKLRPMKTFPNDNLQAAELHGDLSLQICADSQDTVLHALRDIARHTRGAMQVKWRI
ncbi:Dyp-type peroxidase domain-containing protein, partial [Kitasatospora kazusensis]|uniref:Dyp-type peroxidase domain-containing protein n=1 Tax=Kitasatospora kazusensis TaxID=407974 RepID=UPI0031D32A4A